MVKRIPIPTEKNSSTAFFFLFLYIAAVFIRPHQMYEASMEWILIKVFAIICLIATLLGQRPLTLYPQHWMLFLLAPLIILSGFVNGSGMDGVDQSIVFMTTSIIPLFLLSNCLTTVKRQHWLMIACIVASLCMAHNGHVQQTAPNWLGWVFDTQAVGMFGTDIRRITYTGIFNDPNDVGMFFVMTLPFVMYFYYKSGSIGKLLWLTVVSAILYGVFITYSRGTQLGVIGLIGAYYLIVKLGDKAVIAAMICAPIGIVVLTILQSSVDESASGRLEAWYAGILMLLSNVLLGVGRGNFIEVHERTAHNSYILVAAELGVPGYSLWGGALLSTLLTGYLFIRHISLLKPEDLSKNIKEELAVNKALFFSMVGFLITSFFLSRSYTVLLFIFIGMSIASHHRVVKLMPEMEMYFTKALAIKCMLYCWAVIFAVYAALKLAL